MVKHIQKIPRLLPTNYLSVFEHFAGLALKGLIPLQAFSSQWSAYLKSNKSSWVRIFLKLSQTCPVYFNDKIRGEILTFKVLSNNWLLILHNLLHWK